MNGLGFLFWSSFVVGLSGALMPGPVLTATVSEVMKRGFIAGPLIVLGHGLMEVGLLFLLIAGLGDWLALPVARMALGFVGGGLLVLMGAQMILTARRVAERATAKNDPAAPAPLHGPMLAGAATTLSNPYFYVWWGTVGLGYAAVAMDHGKLGLAAFYGGHISSDLVWYSAVAVAIASGRRICPPWLYRLILSACGVALLVLGGIFIRFGLRHL